MTKCTLDQGHNLDILRRYVKDESVDLLYPRPSIDGNVTHKVLCGEQNGSQAAAHEQAYARYYLHDQGVRIKFGEAGFLVLGGGDVTAILESVGKDEMPFLIKCVQRLQEIQGYPRADMRTSHITKEMIGAAISKQFSEERDFWEAQGH